MDNDTTIDFCPIYILCKADLYYLYIVKWRRRKLGEMKLYGSVFVLVRRSLENMTRWGWVSLKWLLAEGVWVDEIP